MANKQDTEDYSNEGRGKEASVGKRVFSTAAKGMGKVLEKVPELNEYLDKKYGENVPETPYTQAARQALFGSNPAASTQKGKDATKALGMYSYAKGGKASSASSRADGIAQRGKTKGRMC